MRFLLFVCFFWYSELIAMIPDSNNSNYQKACTSIKNYVKDYLAVGFFKYQSIEKTIKNNNEITSLARLNMVRAKIVLDSRNRAQIFDRLQPANIDKDIKCLLEFKKSRLAVLADVYHASFSDEILEKWSLLASISLPWNDTIGVLSQFSDTQGIKYDYSFEEAMFVLFLHAEHPGWLYKFRNRDKYEKELRFYINCLASAVKVWIEWQTGTKIQLAGYETMGKSIAENIYLSYVAFTNVSQHKKVE